MIDFLRGVGAHLWFLFELLFVFRFFIYFCSDLVLYVGDVLRGGATRACYVVEDMLGCGTFGQVVRCRRSVEGVPEEDLVAVKVVRNKPAYTKQGLIEIGILEHLNKADNEDNHHVVRMLDYFCVKGKKKKKKKRTEFCSKRNNVIRSCLHCF